MVHQEDGNIQNYYIIILLLGGRKCNNQNYYNIDYSTLLLYPIASDLQRITPSSNNCWYYTEKPVDKLEQIRQYSAFKILQKCDGKIFWGRREIIKIIVLIFWVKAANNFYSYFSFNIIIIKFRFLHFLPHNIPRGFCAVIMDTNIATKCLPQIDISKK